MEGGPRPVINGGGSMGGVEMEEWPEPGQAVSSRNEALDSKAVVWIEDCAGNVRVVGGEGEREREREM